MPSAAASSADRTAGSSASKAASSSPAGTRRSSRRTPSKRSVSSRTACVAAVADLGQDRRDRRDRLVAGRLGARRRTRSDGSPRSRPRRSSRCSTTGRYRARPVDPEAANGNGDACDTRLMTTSRAELGSALTQLRELADRVSPGRRRPQPVARPRTRRPRLYEADRALRTALAVGRAGGRAPLARRARRRTRRGRLLRGAVVVRRQAADPGVARNQVAGTWSRPTIYEPGSSRGSSPRFPRSSQRGAGKWSGLGGLPRGRSRRARSRRTAAIGPGRPAGRGGSAGG